MMKRSLRRRQAFTLIEVLLVIGILLVLGTVSVVAYTRIQAGARRDTAKVLVLHVVEAVKLYQIKIGKFPETDPGLKALVEKPDDEKLAEKWTGGGGPFLENGTVPVDPWDNELKYEYVGTSETGGPEFHVWSVGPDGQDGNDDDIRSWSEQK